MQPLRVVLPPSVAIRILPLGHSVPGRIVAAVILAVVSGAALAADPALARDPDAVPVTGQRAT
jgi:hypothetical protein